MSVYSRPVTEIIAQRFSCRSYAPEPVDKVQRQTLEAAAAGLAVGPLGTPLRFRLAAATEADRSALKGLGTYGFIKGATGFIVGAVKTGPQDMEDYGYGMEQLVLLATDVGLGTCWLGGSFTRSSFARTVAATAGEQVPAVIALGRVADVAQARNAALRRRVGADSRLPWERLFFRQRFGVPLTRSEAGDYAPALDMLRLGPSASNKQPWRVIQAGRAWHFYVQRTPGYGGGLAGKLLKIADMQRVDVGIAMCHFALMAGELGLTGRWVVRDPNIAKPDARTQYVVTWEG
jgi:nitroreductase